MTSLALAAAYAVTLVAVLVVLLLSFLVLSTYLQHLHWKRQGVTCMPFVPLIGHFPQHYRLHQEDRLCDIFKERTALYGDLYSVTEGPISRLSVNSPPHIADVLRGKAECYKKGWINRMFMEKMTGEQNLILLEGDEHAKHRRMLNPAFHHHNLQEMVQLMVQDIDERVAGWFADMKAHPATASDTSKPTSASGEPFVQVDLHRELSATTLSVIARCAFGTSAASVTTTVYDAFTAIGKGIHWRFIRLVPFMPLLRDMPLLHKPEIDAGNRDIVQLAEQIVRDRKAGRTGREKDYRTDLLQLLLSAIDPKTGDAFTDAEVRDEAMTFVQVGHETTANLLCWMLHVCMVRPAVWEACRAEVDSVVKDEPLEYSHLTQLPVIDAVMNETLRLFPPVPVMERGVVKEHVIGHDTSRPVHIPAGTPVQIDVYAVHRLTEYWGDRAEEFDHTRWLEPGKRPHSHPFAFLPFSSGPRNCIGLNFALLEARAFVVRVMQRTRMEWVEGQRMGPDGWPVQAPVVTLRPKYGMQVRIYAREDDSMQRGEAKAK